MSREHDCILAIYMPFVVSHASFGLQDITSKEEIRKAAEWLQARNALKPPRADSGR
jgi:hypothetical protein